MIENIQRRATKLIPGLSDLSYEDCLRRLKLPSLSYRRSRGDMIEVYKIMSGKYVPEISNIFQHQEQENRNTREHKYKLFKPRCRLNIRKNSFCIRVANMWNSLSENVVTTTCREDKRSVIIFCQSRKTRIFTFFISLEKHLKFIIS